VPIVRDYVTDLQRKYRDQDSRGGSEPQRRTWVS